MKYEQRGRVGLLSFDTPDKLNALNAAVLSSLEAELERLRGETDKADGIAALALTGEGRAFVAGADIAAMKGMSVTEAARFSRSGQRVLQKIEDFPVPVIAAVNGFALGGGLEVALACDFIYASGKAKLGLPEVSLGIFPGFNGTQRLIRRIGAARAKELVYTGRVLKAEAALAAGLVNAVVPPEELIDAVVTVGEEIGKVSPHAVREVKGYANLCADQADSGLTLLESERFGRLFDHPDQREGMSAFLEKRAAVWN